MNRGTMQTYFSFLTVALIVAFVLLLVVVIIFGLIVAELSKPDPTTQPSRYKRRKTRDSLRTDLIYETESTPLLTYETDPH